MPPRTNACATCRKKRIKCDATFPQCLMCTKFNRKCPGPGQGAVIIDMSASTTLKNKKKLGEFSTSSLFPSEFAFAMVAQVSQKNIMNEAFYSNFLTYFTSTGEKDDIRNRETWLHRLPQLSTDGKNNALEIALHATASAYCASETSNMALLQDACNLYGRALHMHSQLLRLRKEVTVHMVSTTILLSIFEAMLATTAGAYREHVNGAAKMVELTGPGQCLSGVLCQLFFHIRTQMVFVYLTTRKEEKESVCVPKVLSESLGYKKVPVFQRLMGWVARLAQVYVKEEGFELDEYLEVKGAVGALWSEYQDAAVKKGQELFWKRADGTTYFRNAFTALCVSYFASARILLSLLAPRLAASYPDFNDYHAMILDAARFLMASRIGCAYMRMSTPLYLVALHGKTREQRKEAKSVFEVWGRPGGSMGGISRMALERIYVEGLDEEDSGEELGAAEV